MSIDALLISDYESSLREKLPAKAFKGRTLNLDWLKKARKKNKIIAMCQWFSMRYCDPVHELYYCTQEGGYIWANGGPYEAEDILSAQFSGIVSDEIIDEAVSKIESSGNYQWCKIQDEDPSGFYEPIAEPDIALENIKENLRQVEQIQELNNQIVRNLAFAALISALENFLWQTMKYAINDYKVLKKLLLNLENTQKIEIKKLVNSPPDKTLKAFLQETADQELQNTLWHKLRDVNRIFKCSLDYDININQFSNEIYERHHIVHRLGVDFSNNEIKKTTEDLIKLNSKILSFAKEVTSDIKEIIKSNNSPN